MKFVRREISEIVHYLADKQKKHNFGCLSNCRYCADRAPNLPGPAPNNVLTVLQISSKSVHYWRSYSRMHQRRFLPHNNSPKAILCFKRRIITNTTGNITLGCISSPQIYIKKSILKWAAGEVQIPVEVQTMLLSEEHQQRMHHWHAFSQTAHTAVQRCLADHLYAAAQLRTQTQFTITTERSKYTDFQFTKGQETWANIDG